MGIIKILKDLKGENTKHHRNLIVIFVDEEYGDVHSTKVSIPYGHNYNDDDIFDKVNKILDGIFYRSFKVLQIICCDGFYSVGDEVSHIVYIDENISKIIYGYD